MKRTSEQQWSAESAPSEGRLHITPAGPEASGHAPAFIVLVVFAKLCSGLVAGEPQGRPSHSEQQGQNFPSGDRRVPGKPLPRPGFISEAGPRCWWILLLGPR